VIFYNGATGGIGRHMSGQLDAQSVPHSVLTTRLEDSADLADELDAKWKGGEDATLIHLAALVSVEACENDPARAFDTNAAMAGSTVTAFVHWARRSGIEASVVYASTGHVYAPPRLRQRLDEGAPTDPQSAYARSKLEGERVLSEVASEVDVPLVVARVFGLLGPDQKEGYLLPGLTRRVLSGEVAQIPGLSHTRDYLDARDVCRHLGRLAQWRPGGGGSDTFNVCSGEGIAVGELAEIVVRSVYQDDPEKAQSLVAAMSEAPGRPTDIPWLVGDPGKYVRTFGGSMRRITIAETVRQSIAQSDVPG
jgi:GDP-4-dehydro-6-deoxy-D-mannose reductase